MGLPQSIDPSAPAGSVSPALIDDHIRSTRQAIVDILGIASATSITVQAFDIDANGLDEVIFQNAGAGASAAGRLRRNGANLTWHDGTAARTIDAFASGTSMMFTQASAPTGWTRVVDAGNTDAVIIQRTNSEVPGTGGSWTVSGLTFSGNALATHNHTLTSGGAGNIDTASPPSVTESNTVHVATAGGRLVTGWSSGAGTGTTGTTTSVSGGTPAGTISSAGTWRPQYREVIVATKD